MVASFIRADDVISKQKKYVLQNASSLSKVLGRRPKIAFIVIGKYKPSLLYVKTKTIFCREYGIESHTVTLDERLSYKDVIEIIHNLNENSLIDSILVQLPLPSSLKKYETLILDSVSPDKDCDGLHSINQGLIVKGKPSIVPCTPLACHMFLKNIMPSLCGLHVVIVGNSYLIGRPLCMLLLENDCSCCFVNKETKNIQNLTSQADILISATGIPNLINENWIKNRSIVLDVGIGYINGKLTGDVDVRSVSTKASYITPVPGGIGPVTIFCLIKNTLSIIDKKLLQ